MPTVLRCKSGKSHSDWQQNCDKARGSQIDRAALPPLERNLGEGAFATARAWYPRGGHNEFNNKSLMVSGVVKTSSWHTSGGLQSTYSLAFGFPKKDRMPWQDELAALRAEFTTFSS